MCGFEKWERTDIQHTERLDTEFAIVRTVSRRRFEAVRYGNRQPHGALGHAALRAG